MDALDPIVTEYRSNFQRSEKINEKSALSERITGDKSAKINIELEIRLQDVSIEMFKEMLNAFKTDEFKISKTVNIYDDTASLIKVIDFTDKKTESVVQKKTIKFTMQKKVNNAYRVALSEETVLNRAMVYKSNMLTRIKIRKSFIREFGEHEQFKWRFDLTVISTINDLELVKKEKDKLFAMEFEDLLQDGLKFEIEAELINAPNCKKFRTQDLNTVINFIFDIINPEHESVAKLNDELDFLCIQMSTETVKHPTLKRILNQVTSLTRNEYKDIYPPVGYYVTDKVDGKRAILSIHDDKARIITDEVIEIPYKCKTVTIIDGEYCAETKMFYAFDLIKLNDILYIYAEFSKRISALPVLKDLNYQIKPYTLITADTPAGLEAEISKKRVDVPSDGYIFTKPGNNYFETKNYKYKDMNHNSIDFLIKQAPKQTSGKILYYLFVGITRQMFDNYKMRRCEDYDKIFRGVTFGNYFPIQFSSCNCPNAYIYYGEPGLDGKIGEMIAISYAEVPEWKLLGIRLDRDADLKSQSYYGNDYRVAELTWLNYIDPFDKIDLWNGVRDVYFAGEKESMYSAQISFVSFVKSQRIHASLANMHSVIDIAAGKGQDLFRYFRAQIKNIYCLDKDKSALSELIRRRLEHRERPASVHVMVADMNEPFNLNIGRLNSHFGLKMVNAVVCNLAVHYFLQSVDSMVNFISFCRSICPSGIVCITCFFGETIHKLLTGDSWDSYQDDVLKYSIKKKYEGPLLPAGQVISVKLPFSGDQYYDEYLVNTAVLIEQFAKFGFKLVSKKSMIEYLDMFLALKHTQKHNLTDADKTYISLYGELVFSTV